MLTKYAYILLVTILMMPQVVTNASDMAVEDLYMQNCYVCHGEDGSGNMPGVPDLSDNSAVFTEDENKVVARIKNGIQNPGKIGMPPKGGNQKLTDKELLSVFHYIKNIIKQ